MEILYIITPFKNTSEIELLKTIKSISFLRLNLKFGHECRKSFLNNDGFEVGTLEYKSCVMNKGQAND